MENKISIGIDLDNGDAREIVDYHIPDMERFIEPVNKIAKENPNTELVLVGLKGIIEQNSFNVPNNCRFIYSPEYCPPSKKISKPIEGSSLNILTSLVKSGQVKAFFTIGDTRKVCIELMRLKRLEGVKRGTLVAQFPSEKGGFLYGDVGASSQKSLKIGYKEAINEIAYQEYTQGLMTCVLGKECFGIKPRLGVLSNGIEEHKGSDLSNRVEELFIQGKNEKSLSEFLDYYGKAEPYNALNGDINILLTDGFTGNTSLKFVEAAVKHAERKIKKEFEKLTLLQELSLAPGSITLRKMKQNIKQDLHPDQYAGAVLLGYPGVIVKGHGNSKSHEIYYGIKKTILCAKGNLSPKIEETLAKYSLN